LPQLPAVRQPLAWSPNMDRIRDGITAAAAGLSARFMSERDAHAVVVILAATAEEWMCLDEPELLLEWGFRESRGWGMPPYAEIRWEPEPDCDYVLKGAFGATFEIRPIEGFSQARELIVEFLASQATFEYWKNSQSPFGTQLFDDPDPSPAVKTQLLAVSPVGAWLRYERRLRNWRFADAAEAMGISAARATRYESGVTAIPDAMFEVFAATHSDRERHAFSRYGPVTAQELAAFEYTGISPRLIPPHVPQFIETQQG
jgi:hypothetical protein